MQTPQGDRLVGRSLVLVVLALACAILAAFGCGADSSESASSSSEAFTSVRVVPYVPPVPSAEPVDAACPVCAVCIVPEAAACPVPEAAACPVLDAGSDAALPPSAPPLWLGGDGGTIKLAVFSGDSNTAGFPIGTNNAYPALVGPLFGQGFQVRNVGVSGENCQQFAATFDADGGPGALITPGALLSVMIGTNSLRATVAGQVPADPVAAWSDTATALREARTLGALPIVLMEVLPSTMVDEPARQRYNGLVHSEGSALADMIVDSPWKTPADFEAQCVPGVGDHLHMNKSCHGAYAGAWFATVKPWFEAHP